MVGAKAKSLFNNILPTLVLHSKCVSGLPCKKSTKINAVARRYGMMDVGVIINITIIRLYINNVYLIRVNSSYK